MQEDQPSKEDDLMTAEYPVIIPPALVGWSKNEKYDLYLGLRHSRYNIKEIQKRLPNKTEEQIQAVIDHYKAELSKRTEPSTSRLKKKIKHLPQIPLAKWADLMTETYNYEDLQTEFATAIRHIANFEDFAHPSACANIDFRKIYHYIADAMEGKPLPDDPIAADVFNHCVMETASMSKAFIPKNELQDLLGGMDSDCNINTPRPTKDGGLAALRYLAMQKNYNPLNIPEKYLHHLSQYTDEK